MSSSTKAIITVIVLVLVGAGAYFVTKDKTEDTASEKSTTTTSTTPAKTETTKDSTDTATEESASSDLAGPITKEQVALHASKDDCWTIIDGDVYDITSYIPRHPGGTNILSACGVDATDFFNGDKAGQAGGSNDHSGDSKATSQLASLKLGALSN